MGIASKQRLKAWFGARKYPTAEQFASLFDSFFHKTDDIIPIASVDDLPEQLNNKLSTSEANIMRSDIAQNTTLINGLNADLNRFMDNLDTAAIEAAMDDVADALVELPEMESLARRSAQLLPLHLNLAYLRRITYGNPVVQKIVATLLPTYQIPNVLYLGDGRAVDVLPDGTMDVLALGTSRIHVIPTTNTQLYQTINVEVVPPSIMLAETDSMLLIDNFILLT